MASLSLNSNLLVKSQLVHAINHSSLDQVRIICWNVDIDWETKRDEKAEAPESQSQGQDSHSFPPAQCTPPRDMHMAEVEQSLHYSGESFDNPLDLVSEAKCCTSTQQVLGWFSGSTPNVQ